MQNAALGCATLRRAAWLTRVICLDAVGRTPERDALGKSVNFNKTDAGRVILTAHNRRVVAG